MQQKRTISTTKSCLSVVPAINSNNNLEINIRAAGTLIRLNSGGGGD